MKLLRLTSLLLLIFCLSVSCSSDDEEEVEDRIVLVGGDGDDGGDEVSQLEQRFVFNEDIVIENSYNTGGCGSPPCDTIDESLVNVFVNEVPDDAYFYLATDESELECQLEKGRRIEFKQITEGPLTSFSRIELEGIYYDIPDNGVTIAQVHNRGGNSNKPFFRLVLHENGLETVIRKDPEVSSSNTTFQKQDFTFIGGANYDQSSLKLTVEKSAGSVHIRVEQNDTVILNESYAPDTTTRWVSNNGIANGFYLKAGLYNDDGPHTKSLVAGYSTVKFESND